MLNVTVLCFTFVSTQQRVTWPQMLSSLVMLHNTFWDDCASGFHFLTRRRTLDKRLNISYLIEVGKHVCTCTSTHLPSWARSLSPSNRPQDVFQERRLNGDAPMVSLVQPAGLDFLWGCSLAQLCIWKLILRICRLLDDCQSETIFSGCSRPTYLASEVVRKQNPRSFASCRLPVKWLIC